MQGFTRKSHDAERRRTVPRGNPTPARPDVAQRRPAAVRLLGLLALLCASLVPQVLLASPAAAADWVLNLDDTGYDPTAAGGTIVYSITVGNGSPVAASANTITLSVPATTSFTGGTGTITGCTPVPAVGVGTVTCQIPPLAPGQEASLSASVKTTAAGLIYFTAEVMSPPGDPDLNPGNNKKTELTTVSDGADVELTIAGPATATAGSMATYVYTLSNLGPDAARNLTLTVPAPLGLTNIVTPAGCVLASGNYTCTVPGPLAANGAPRTFSFTGQAFVPPSSQITMSGAVTVGSLPSDPDDPVPGNNTTSLKTNVLSGSDLALTKSRAPAGVLVLGQDVTFTLNASFTGSSPTGIKVVDELPVQYEFVSATATPAGQWVCGAAGQTVTCDRASGPGGSGNQSLGAITISTRVKATGQATNTATISATSPIDPRPENDTATDGGTLIQAPIVDLAAQKVGPPLVVPGNSYDFSISTRNTSANIASVPYVGEIEMVDTLPVGLEVTGYSALNGWSCTPPASVASPVKNPTKVSCIRTYTQAAPLQIDAETPPVVLRTKVADTVTAPINNRLEVQPKNPIYTDGYTPNNVIDFGSGTSDFEFSADVRTTKTAALPAVGAGEIQTFAIEISNSGPVVATDLVASDDVENLINGEVGVNDGIVDVSYVPASASGMTCSTLPLTSTSRRLSCSIATLPVCTPGVDCPLITVQVRPRGWTTAATTPVTRSNRAQAVSNQVADPNLDNNEGVSTYQVEPRANVWVQKTVNPATVRAGQNIIYTINARTTSDNRGPAENVTVTDTLPGDLTFISVTPSAGSCIPPAVDQAPPAAGSVTTPGNNIVKCNLGTIAQGGVRSMTIVARPRNATSGQPPLVNTAVVSTSTQGDDTADNTATASLSVTDPSLDLLINKTDMPDPTAVGETTKYTLRATNRGPSAAENVIVTDTMPTDGLLYISSSIVGSGGSCSTIPVTRSVAGTLVCYFDTISAGQTREIKVVMEGLKRGRWTNAASVTSDEVKAGFDTLPGNESVTEDTTVRARADVEVASKVPSSPSVALREPFTFAILVRNRTGPQLAEAEGVTLTDPLPAGMEIAGTVSASVTTGTATENVCRAAGNRTSFSCSFGTLSSGAEVLVTVPVIITALTSVPQTFTNVATVSTTSFDEDLSNNSNSGYVVVGSAASLTGTVFRDFNGNGVQDPGDTGVAGVPVTITGTTTDGAPVSLTAATASNGNYDFSFLPAGTYGLTRGLVSDPALSNGIAKPGTAGGTAQGPTEIIGITLATQAAAGYDFTLIPNTGIAITKALLSGPTANSDGSFDAGFRLTVSNPSPEALQNISVTDVLAGAPPLFGTFAASPTAPGTYGITTAPSGTCSGLNAGFNGSSDTAAAQGAGLAAGASCTIDFAIRVMPTVPLPPVVNGGRYINKASASGTGTQSGTDVSGDSNLVPLSPNLPQLTIAKVMTGYSDLDNSGSITLGDVLTFRITATNAGSATLNDVVVSDPMISPDSTACPVLQPDEACVLTGTYTVTIADVQAGSVVNTASADSSETNPVTGPLTATVTTPVVAVVDENTLSKTALISTAKRGEKVPYVIVAQKVPFNPARIVDVMPPGFAFIEGSAVANGSKVAPTVDGRRLIFDGLVPDKGGSIKLELTLVVSASVNPGTAVNQAQLVNPARGQVVATAKAKVTILAEAIFDCGDIIGKVFDDKNRNGYQDEGEPGLPAVRVATVNGLLVTTDPDGRFNIPCADIPDADIGSNFILKLDTRTLPTGYHVTTENPRRVRMTRGKVVKLNFGASISRLVKLELNGKVFTKGSNDLLPKWQAGLDKLIAALAAETSVLEITYRGDDALAKARLRAVKNEVAQRWKAVPDHYELAIDTRLVAGGAP